jgi:phenylacetate-CoA ligase
MSKQSTFSAKKILQSYYDKPESYWLGQQRRLMTSLFARMSKKLPAYIKFLKLNRFTPSSVKNYADLVKIPYINKYNYFSRYGLKQVSWEGAFEKQGLVMTSTSGSTGMPTYFARGNKIDEQYSVLAELFLANGPKGSTLLIDCFGMGVWIGGLITYQAFKNAAFRGWPVTIITPGINKKEIFHSLRELAPKFKNVILAGYPPFLKDVLDEAAQEQVVFKKFHTRLLFAAESFTEIFRDYVAKKAGIKDPYHDTLNLYGSAELGAMAFETPLSIFIRRQALKHPALYRQLFSNNRIPTLAQYNPEFVSFTHEHGEILLSADSTAPFMNYKIGDNGGTYSLAAIKKIFAEHKINLHLVAKKAGIKITTLPFVYIYERSDLSTKLYGAIIYPQHIRQALQTVKLSKYFSGKFLLATKTDRRHDQRLEINLEMKKGCRPSPPLIAHSRKLITESLIKNNAEYKNNYHMFPHKVTPKIILWDNEDPLYFKAGIKQNWVSKQTSNAK